MDDQSTVEGPNGTSIQHIQPVVTGRHQVMSRCGKLPKMEAALLPGGRCAIQGNISHRKPSAYSGDDDDRLLFDPSSRPMAIVPNQNSHLDFFLFSKNGGLEEGPSKTAYCSRCAMFLKSCRRPSKPVRRRDHARGEPSSRHNARS